MKILIDENMPCAFELFSHTGEVLCIPGRPLPISKLKNASGLMVRSVTNVNATLLADTEVKFVGTATSGTDHIDFLSLEKAGINFAAAPGCNAIAVVEYVFSALLLLAERDNFNLRDRTVGIVGVGNIGSCLYNRLKVLGVKTLLCDPIRAAITNCNQNDFYSLDELVAQVDIITLHTSLLKDGPYKSWHLVDSNLLMALQPKTILINTCRGPVVDNTALLQVLNKRSDLSVVLDVWENEPNISLELLNKVDIATAHIAGYTIEGKVRGTVQIFKAWCNFIGKSQSIEDIVRLLPTSDLGIIMLNGILDQPTLKRLITLMYDIRYDDIMFRKFAMHSGGFDYLRKYYQERREWSSLQIICNNFDTASILKLLGFRARFKNLAFNY